ncbi:hypothetical protein PN498_28150 [Oscillatoria sp. CS-180]|uniref:hypothetical protein n=1 Tax=Oscillatoria sp. CS-180 TaxID=3021720 RepID=UPI00232B0582|nr:hypothetical protein [Oscillatoria sp. CS-180]MDB9529891.1 hypothetical protein [Oscillatoria sp. CS-180]
MHQAAIDLFQLLVQAGAVPGQDFSCDPDQQAYHLNERCYDLLQRAYPEVDWHDVLGAPFAGIMQRIEKLHQQLGCPFVTNIVASMQHRLPHLPDDLAAGYIQAILIGVESATGIALYPFLMETFSLTEQARLEWLLRQEAIAIPGSDCLMDLIMAAGANTSDFAVQNGETVLTEAGWQRLSVVWDGDCLLQSAIAPR